MSTRCQLEFRFVWKDNKGKERVDRRTVYRHSDGYPDGVIPDLKEFLKWNSDRNNDVEYSAANFIYWSKRTNEDQYLNRRGEKKKKWNGKEVIKDHHNILKIGFGVCKNDEFHGDIQYFYHVETDEKGKTVIKCFENWGKDMTKFKPIKIVKVK